MQKYFLTTLIIISLFSAACEKIIDIDIPDKEKKIVINAILSTDSLVKVNVSKSINILDDANALFLDNAIVNLYENNSFVEKLTGTGNGNYITTSFQPQVGKTYKIEVESSGLESVTATNRIPEKVSISSIDTTEINYGVQLTLHFTDPANETNYYFLQLKTYVKYDYYGTSSDDGLQDIYFSTNDNIVDKESESFFSPGITFNDNLINGQSYALKVNIDAWDLYSDTNTVYIYFCSISKDFYLYIKSYVQNLTNRDDIFSEPVQVYENIDGGYGIFAGYAPYLDSVLVITEDYYY